MQKPLQVRQSSNHLAKGHGAIHICGPNFRMRTKRGDARAVNHFSDLLKPEVMSVLWNVSQAAADNVLHPDALDQRLRHVKTAQRLPYALQPLAGRGRTHQQKKMGMRGGWRLQKI